MGLSVRETVALGRHPYSGWSGRLDDRDERIIDDALEAAAASPLASRRVAELSDGERQRVAIARAIAQEPDVLILDEPTAFLDPRARLNVMSLLRRLTAAKRFAAVVATHDLELVLPHATQVWVAGQATLVTGALTDDHVCAALRTELGADVTTVDGRPHITYEDSL
jgi:iron complex transport system ATP-binding protein